MPSDHIKTVPQYIAPKRALTAFAGFMANLKVPAIKNYLIHDFIQKYQVNMQEAKEEQVEHYACFNDFFVRHLKAECRPVADAGVVSPVDGVISEIGRITSGRLLQAKGRDYTVSELLACESALSTPFDNGSFATLYLSPKDYHRVHMPMDATLREMIYVPGKLFSVQPTTARVIPRLFARNERLVVFFDTSVGLMAMVLVGATIVGAIGTAWHGDIRRGRQRVRFDYAGNPAVNTQLQKAAEMGYFKLGSTVVLLFADGERMQWRPDLQAGCGIRFGEALGSVV
ncbi:MAG TPA: phosphatidylserine decarboxylase [Legionella sp.]|nr:phosphatidylserine decarboxylase [Legionella sp.]